MIFEFVETLIVVLFTPFLFLFGLVVCYWTCARCISLAKRVWHSLVSGSTFQSPFLTKQQLERTEFQTRPPKPNVTKVVKRSLRQAE